jgi:hypothetical protein
VTFTSVLLSSVVVASLTQPGFAANNTHAAYLSSVSTYKPMAGFNYVVGLQGGGGRRGAYLPTRADGGRHRCGRSQRAYSRRRFGTCDRLHSGRRRDQDRSTASDESGSRRIGFRPKMTNPSGSRLMIGASWSGKIAGNSARLSFFRRVILSGRAPGAPLSLMEPP